MSTMYRRQSGFTIVELLIVIVVIGILAAITIVAYNGIQDRANQARVDSDLSKLHNAIVAARVSTDKTLGEIVGNWWSSGVCHSKLATEDLAKLPKNDPCWVNYLHALETISAASGANLMSLTDPWGRPYSIDANEGEPAPSNPCVKDTLGFFSMTSSSSNTIQSVRRIEHHRSACG